MKEDKSYQEGLRNGWLDRSMGVSSVIAKTSTYGAYAKGYIQGQIDHANGVGLPIKEEGA